MDYHANDPDLLFRELLAFDVTPEAEPVAPYTPAQLDAGARAVHALFAEAETEKWAEVRHIYYSIAHYCLVAAANAERVQ